MIGVEFLETLTATALGAVSGSYAAFRFEARGRRSKSDIEHVIAANKGLLALRTYWIALLKYGQRSNLLAYSEMATDIGAVRLPQEKLGFLMAHDNPAMIANLLDAESMCRQVIERINRLATISPGGEEFLIGETLEFNTIQQTINEKIVPTLEILKNETIIYHRTLVKVLGKRLSKRLIGIDYILDANN